MFRYRCPQCTQLLQAPEIRAGKTTVCSKCSQPLTIPADKTEWLNERGEPLLTSPTVVIRGGMLTPSPTPRPRGDSAARSDVPDNDVLGAIFMGEITPTGPMTIANYSGAAEEESASDINRAPELAPEPTAVSALDLNLPGMPEADPDPETEPPALVLPPRPDTTPELPAAAAIAPDAIATPKTEPLTPAAETTRDARPPEPAVEPAPPRYPTPLPRAFPERPLPSEPVPEPPVPAAAAVAGLHSPPSPPRIAPLPVPTRRSVAESRPFGQSVAVGAGGHSNTGWGAGGSRSGPRSRRMVATSPVHPADEGRVALQEPLRLRTGMDLAVNLTSALTSRMKPPPAPPRDLKPSTAAWLLLTGAAAALLFLTLTTARDFNPVVVALGTGQIVIGYVWIVYLACRRDWRRGVLAAVPPVAAWFLFQWKYAKYRPLRFVGTGAALIVLASAATYFAPRTRAWAGVSDGSEVVPAAPPITSQSKLAQLQYYQSQRSYEQLVKLLQTLATTDPQFSDEAKNRVELAAELRKLCKHTDAGVKVEALAAYATWGGADARDVCLEASRQTNREERLMALRQLPRWKDESVARAVAEHIGRAGLETAAAQDALVAIGGTPAERAVIPLLRSGDQGVRLTAIDLLGDDKIGGAEAVKALQDTARLSPDPGTRQPAAAKAEQIQARIGK